MNWIIIKIRFILKCEIFSYTESVSVLFHGNSHKFAIQYSTLPLQLDPQCVFVYAQLSVRSQSGIWIERSHWTTWRQSLAVLCVFEHFHKLKQQRFGDNRFILCPTFSRKIPALTWSPRDVSMTFSMNTCISIQANDVDCETAICRKPHDSSKWDSRTTRQLGYKHTFCQNLLTIKNC